MKKLNLFSIHLICWAVLLFYSYGKYLLEEKVGFYDVAFSLSMTTVQIIEFYICYLWVFPAYLKRGKLFPLFAGILLAFAAFVVCRYLIEEVIYLALFGIHNYASDTPISHYIIDNIYYGSWYIVVAGAAWGLVHAFQAERKNSLLKEEAKKAELAFLKSQINPHFLYNTLNYIYFLAIPVSDQLAKAVIRLSDLMRYTLNESPDGKVMLSRELEYLESYIELFRMRFEPDFYVLFTQELVQDQKIASLLLIPFVENAFKHGVVNDSEQPVKIALKMIAKKLVFSVDNQISRQMKDHSSGIGLANIQRRLDLIYPGRHELEIVHDHDRYSVTLVIDLFEI